MAGSQLTFSPSLAYIDRSNLGNAKIAGMYDDLELYGMKYNTALTVFFVTYTIFEIPSNVVSYPGDLSASGRGRVDRPALHFLTTEMY